jgi:hypothetical protein
MEKIPTAKEIILKHCNTKTNDYGTFFSSISDSQCINAMIEFTKLHVEQALKEALESIPCLGSSSDIASYEEVRDAVLNSYPIENIK